MNTSDVRYSGLSKLFHWFIAIVVVLMLSFSFFLDDLPKHYQGLAYLLHKSTGLTILFLMILRLYWIHHRGKPALPETVPLWEKVLSRVVQYSLYVVLLIQPLCGWVMSVAAGRVPSYFGLFNLPLPVISPNKALAHWLNEAHTVLAWVLIALIMLHVLGALKHYFIDKDRVLQSMLPARSI